MKPSLLATLLSISTLSLGACGTTTDSSSTTYAAITAIVVRAEAARSGSACGEGTSQVFKYAAVLRNASGQVVSAGVYDCFADAAFRDPPFDLDKPTPTFKVDIHALDKSAYDAKGAVAVANAARVGDAAVLGAPTVACEATPRYEVEVVAVCTGQGNDAGAGGVDASSDGAPTPDGS